MRWNRRMMAVAVVGAMVVPIAGCGDDPVGPQTGTVQAALADGGEGSEALRGDGPMSLSSAQEVSGEFRGTGRVQLLVDGEWQDLSGLSNVSFTGHLRVGGPQTWGSAQASARTYEAVRVVLTGAEAEVDAGSDLGGGSLEANVTVSIGEGGELVLELPAPLTVQANASTLVVLQLNSHLWLDEQAVAAGTVSKAAFETAAQFSVMSQ